MGFQPMIRARVLPAPGVGQRPAICLVRCPGDPKPRRGLARSGLDESFGRVLNETMAATKPLEVGGKAPAFHAVAVGGEYGEGREVSLKDFSGQYLILYFYPKDDTPGCTAQACALRDEWYEVSQWGALFGVSIDPPEKHRKFIDKYDLPFPLLSDPDKELVENYGVWVEKSMYGKKYMGTERTTVVIGPDGKIAAIFPKVKPGEHLDLLRKQFA